MRVLITGGSSGIGRDIAREFAKKGYELILVAKNEDKLLKVKEELDTKVEIISMDLSNRENVIKLHETVKNVDILINNAGFGVFGEFSKTDLKKELDLIDTNITAVHILTKLYLQDMKKQGSGQILNVASISGFMPGPLMDAYYASKAYVVRLTEGIYEELNKEKSNIKISVLCPGPVDTNFNNVADVKFNLPSLSSQYVAKYTVEKMLKGKFMIIPGLKIKLLKILAKISPNNLTSKVVYIMQERKRK